MEYLISNKFVVDNNYFFRDNILFNNLFIGLINNNLFWSNYFLFGGSSLYGGVL